MPDLVVEKISKEFRTSGPPLRILREASLSLSAGENAAILGPSGSGKSTLLHIIGGLDSPTAGSVTLGGENPLELTPAGLAHFRNQNIGFVFQDHYLLPQLTVLENVLMPALAEGLPTAEHGKRARYLLKRVGLADREDHRPAELSGGERQRVGVARALLLKPKLLLADEPTGNLDRLSGDAVGTLLLEIQHEENTMLLVVTHSTQLAERMQQRLELVDGLLVKA